MWDLESDYNETVLELLERGDKLMSNKQYLAARELYQRILKDNPEDEYIKYKLGDSFYREDNLDEAQKLFKEAIEINPKFLQALTMLGIIAIKRNDKKSMEIFFEKAFEISPENPYVLTRKGRVYLYLKDYEKALEKYTQALELNPEIDEAWQGIISMLFFSEQIDLISKFIDDMIKNNSRDPAFLSLKGILHCFEEKYDIALTFFEKAQGIKSSIFIPWIMLAERTMSKNDYNFAEIFLKKEIERNPDSEIAWSLLALIYKKKKMIAEAAEAIEQVLRINPQNMKARISLITLNFQDDSDEFDVDESMDLFDRAFSFRDEERKTNGRERRIIQRLFEKKKYKQVVEICLNALEIEPENSNLLLTLSDAYFELGKFQKAYVNFSKILDLTEELEYVKLRIGKTLVKLGRFKEALKIFEKYEEDNPDAYLDLYYAELFQEKKQYAKSLEYLMRKEKTSIEVDYKIAEMYMLMNKKDEALIQYQKAIMKHQRNTFYQRNDIDELIQIFEKEIEKSENTSGILNILGILFFLKKEYQKAQDYFEDSLKNDPLNWKTLKIYGIFFKSRREFDSAIIFLEQARTTEETQEDSELLEDLSNCYKLIKNCEKSLEYNLKIELLDPDNYVNLSEIARNYEEQGELDKAEEYLNKAIEKINVLDLKIHRFSLERNYESLAKILSKKSEWKKAVNIYEKLVKENPENGNYYYDLAIACDNIGNHGYAVKNFDKAIDLDPNYWIRIEQIAFHHFEQKRFEKTAETAQKFLELRHDSERIRNILGYSLYMLDRDEEAKKHLKKSLEFDYENIFAHMILGGIFFNQSKYEDSMFHYKRILEIEPENEIANNELSKIYLELGNKEKSRELYLKSLGFE